MISRKVKLGELGVNMNCNTTGILIQTTDEHEQARVVLNARQTEELIERLQRLVTTLKAVEKDLSPPEK